MAKISLDDIDINDVLEFMETGNVNDAPEHIVDYLVLIEKIHGMYLRNRQFGSREQVIKHLILVDKKSRYIAEKLYDEMLFYFYKGNTLSKEVWRNIIFEKMQNLATAAELTATNNQDFERASRIWERAGKLKQLDVVDPPPIPKEAFAKPYKVYAMDPEFLGEKPINRLELAKQIDALEDFSPAEKELLKEEAAINPIKLFDNADKEELRQPER